MPNLALFKIHCETDQRLFRLEPLRQNLCGISNTQPFADHPFAQAPFEHVHEQAISPCSGGTKPASQRSLSAERPFGLTSTQILSLLSAQWYLPGETAHDQRRVTWALLNRLLDFSCE